MEALCKVMKCCADSRNDQNVNDLGKEPRFPPKTAEPHKPRHMLVILNVSQRV